MPSFLNNLRNKHPPAGPFYLVVSHDLSESTKQLFEDLISAIGKDHSAGIAAIAQQLTKLDRKVDEFMATQEERLQTILTAIKTVKQMLIDLKANNPNIEDEIGAIEAELDITKAEEPPANG